MEMAITQEPTGPDAPQAEHAAEPQAPVQPPAAEPNPAAPVEQPEPAAPAEDAPATDEAVSKFVQDAGFDPIDLSKQIATTGDIAPEAKTALGQKLEKAGLPASMVDEYITGQKAVLAQAVNDIMSMAGGPEGYQELAEWGKANLSDAELAAFNKIMETADINTAKLTVGNMYARYQASTGRPGQRVRGVTAANAPGDVFKSWEQQKAAQRDPRYQKDPAYRAEVEDKIARTLQAGGYR